MTFHRLSNPSYYVPGGGALPVGYDLLNDPSTTGGTGIAMVPDSGPKAGGTYDGVYFVVDGNDEPANAYNLGRPIRALAESIDLLDDSLRQSIAKHADIGFTAGGGGDASTDLDGSTTEIFVGDAVVDARFLFIVATSLGTPIFVDGVRVSVTSITGATIGDGFTNANPLTLTFNKTIPAGTNYYILYAVRDTMGSLAVASFSYKTGRGTLNYEDYRYDEDVVTVSNPTSGPRGDYHATSLTALIGGALGRGDLVVRVGDYIVDGSADWSEGTHVRARRTGDGAKISVDSSRAANVNLTAGLAFHDVSLGTGSTTSYHFVAQLDFLYESTTALATVQAGSLELAAITATVSHKLRNLRTTANATLTTADAGLKVTSLGCLDAENISIEHVPSGASPLAYMYVTAYTGRAHIRNSRIGGSASGIDGLRINGSASTVNLMTFENCNIYHNGTGDAWAVNIINSTNIVFKNCRFFSERGQAARIENSGVTFIDCTFEAGTDTGLTNAQLICGEGYVSGANQENSLKFINCRAVYNDANVRATGAPTKPIIELGGRGATVHPGRVEVDGLYIRPDDSAVLSHQYTAVLLLSHTDNKSPNSYRNITIDELARAPTGAGTLAKYDSSFTASALLVEAVGISTTDKVLIENLKIINVKAPATALARGIAGFDRCTVRGFTLDGSTASADKFSAPLVHSRTSALHNSHFFPTASIETSSYCLSTENGNVTTELRYHRRGDTTDVDGPIVGLNTASVLDNAIIYIDVSLTTSTRLISPGISCRVTNSTIVMNGTLTGGAMIDAGGADKVTVQGCMFHWTNTGDTIADITSSNYSVVTGNQFLSTSTAPTVSHSGTTRIPDGSTFVPADMNVIAGSASITIPTTY